jgi:hypothetical protein
VHSRAPGVGQSAASAPPRGLIAQATLIVHRHDTRDSRLWRRGMNDAFAYNTSRYRVFWRLTRWAAGATVGSPIQFKGNANLRPVGTPC